MKIFLCFLTCISLIFSRGYMAPNVTNESIPDEVQKFAEENFSVLSRAVMAFADEWDITNPDEMDRITLGIGERVYTLKSDNINNIFTHKLSQHIDDSVYPIWLYTFDLDGESAMSMEIMTDDGGKSYSINGYGGSPEYVKIFNIVRNRFTELLVDQGATPNIVLYSVSGRYIFASNDGVNEWALPVPLPFETEMDISNWQTDRLWTSKEILQSVRNAVNANVEDDRGVIPEFAVIPQVEFIYANGWIVLAFGALLLIAVFAIVFIIIKKRAKHKKVL